ncbi:ABC transporter permease, partial [Pontimonas sp.]|nr:ABC transporter permease [Pontimonas sp.]
MEFFNNWWGFVSTRWDQVQIGLIEHSVYVVSVLGVASVFAIFLGVVTRRSPLARELSLAISSVFLTI